MERISGKELKNDLKSIDMERICKKEIINIIDDYVFTGGKTIWNETEIPKVQKLIKAITGVSESEFTNILMMGNPDNLRELVRNKTCFTAIEQIDEICNVLTKGGVVNESL